MQKNITFFICRHCGNLSALLINSGVPTVCCGEKMTQLVPNTAEASVEKHLPAVVQDGNTLTVQIGSTLHPATPEHHIGFVYIETQDGGCFKYPDTAKEPIVTFIAEGSKPVAVYAFCNLHGLWKTQI